MFFFTLQQFWHFECIYIVLVIITPCPLSIAHTWFCWDICLSVRLSHVGIVSKWLNNKHVICCNFFLSIVIEENCQNMKYKCSVVNSWFSTSVIVSQKWYKIWPLLLCSGAKLLKLANWVITDVLDLCDLLSISNVTVRLGTVLSCR